MARAHTPGPGYPRRQAALRARAPYSSIAYTRDSDVSPCFVASHDTLASPHTHGRAARVCVRWQTSGTTAESTERCASSTTTEQSETWRARSVVLRRRSNWMETIRQHGCESHLGPSEEGRSATSALSEESLRRAPHSGDMGEPVFTQPTGERVRSGDDPVSRGARLARMRSAQRAGCDPRGTPSFAIEARRFAAHSPYRRLGARAGTCSGIPRAAVKTAGGKAHT